MILLLLMQITGWTEPNYQPFYNDDSDWVQRTMTRCLYRGNAFNQCKWHAYLDTENDKKPVCGYKYREINQSARKWRNF